jgi:serine/threonine-protein kinase 24/25/MST4
MSTLDPKHPKNRYELLEKIGKGGYGYVCKARDKMGGAPGCDKTVAIKIINLEDAGDEMEDINQEIAVMSNINCTQLTKYFTSHVVEANLWIVMEYLEAGALLDIIKATGPLREEFVAYIMKELLTALVYLHAERKIHRDVKAGNILVSSEGRVKLADFGVAGQLTDSTDKRSTKIGTPFWMAPEVISQSRYDGCADVWSTGITAIELSKGAPPYANQLHPFQATLLIPRVRSPPSVPSMS